MSMVTTEQPLGYAEFGRWYDAWRAETLDPALAAGSEALEVIFADQLSERDRARIRSTSGRVKSQRRTWRKIHQDRYKGQITSVEEIPNVIDDLVGLRVTCVNVRDIEMVQAALDSLPRRRTKGQRLWLDPSSERDYVLEPKESGYRGWHVNLGIAVKTSDGRRPVTCELQVRTLLQDGWGELTHEDTYSKDGALPPLVEVLSRRMADLLSTLDDIAEDLRNELDRIDAAVVAETTEATATDDEAETEQAADAAGMLLERWRGLDRPTDLASLAWELQREFGAEVSDGWFGHGSFKRFMLNAVPEGEVSTGRQAYLLPSAGPVVETAETVEADAESESKVPAAARRLRRTDRGFPLLEAEQWTPLYATLAEAWRRVGPSKPSTKLVNQLTRSARDQADAAGRTLSRRHLDYVAKAVLSVEGAGEPLDAGQMAEVFTSHTLQRMADLRILDPKQRKARSAVKKWLAGS